jgi:hypothetical protein
METKPEMINNIVVSQSVSKTKQEKKKVELIIEDEEIECEDEIINETICSKNSLTAKSGFKAEEIFRTDNKIKMALETYFKLNVVSMEKIQGKKYDTLMTFNNNIKLNIQNNKIENLQLCSMGGRNKYHGIPLHCPQCGYELKQDFLE